MQIVGVKEDLPDLVKGLATVWRQTIHSWVEMEIPENPNGEATKEKTETPEIKNRS